MKESLWMNAEAYFAIILNILVGLIFIALVLGFLYMIYGREKKPKKHSNPCHSFLAYSVKKYELKGNH